MRRMSHSILQRSTNPRFSSDILGCGIPKLDAIEYWLIGPNERTISAASWRRRS
jgi:hypothetical protein